MARLRYVEKENATPDQERALAQVTQKSGKIANIWKLWSHSPETLETFMTFYKTLLKTSLDPKLRELVYLKASTMNGCAYCAGAHVVAGRRAGLTDEQIEAVGQFADSPLFTPLEKLALRYAEELTATVRTSDTVMNELKEHLSETNIIELNLIIGVANLTNRFNMSFMTDPD
ncbi:MAG TPA: carboxymuconolactone decarboxylase family protein [Terriglobia bacterium]|nr:carboxymuconolactone decarboxylase family protein [Terriglobia bacterium]